MDVNLLQKTPQAGSPFITPDIIFFYFLLFFFSVGVVYLIFHFIKRPQNPNHFKNLFLFSIIAKILVITAAVIVAAYYFLPTPKVAQSSPNFNTQNVPVRTNIVIKFDRPVSRGLLEKKITPEIPGVWRFEVGLYKTHFYRKLVFYPDVTLLPETQYKIDLINVKNVSKLSSPQNYSFTFKTEALPKIINAQPMNNATDVSTDSRILLDLDKPNNDLADFNFVISPSFEYSLNLSPDKTFYSIIPKEELKQGTTYKLKVSKTPTVYNLKNEVVYRGDEINEHEVAFTTKNPPGISNFSPSGENVLLNSPININFSKAMVKKSVEEKFSTNPETKGNFLWENDTKLTYYPQKLAYDTNYSLIIAKGAASRDGTFVENDIVLGFKTIGPVRLVSIVSSDPNNINQGIGINNNLRFNFNQAVDRFSAQNHFSISPAVDGDFSWEESTLVFKPKPQLQYDTTYTVSFSPGIKSINGLDSKETFSVSLGTESFIFKLSVPIFLQKYALSCEVAGLSMILSFKGISTDEDSLFNLLGFDNTPRQDGIWGDPNVAFVGNFRGKQMKTGYGVYWGPIERVAKNFRDAKSFSGWSLAQITDQVLKGNPVQVWVYARGGVPTNWNTPSGDKIFAVSGEHTLVVKGFVGRSENPSQIIVNDSLIGEVYLSQADFNKKWDTFGRSGVVVF